MSALKGIRILDLTHMLSGPYCTMMLADLGADMIKIEPPHKGEGTRRLLEKDPKNSFKGMGAYYMTLNRNKKSVTLNLKSEEGLDLFYQLVQTADVVIDNFSVGVTERLKIDYAHLCQINPLIITASITGFGQTGPGKNRVAFDMVAQAAGGGMSITGHPNTPPTRAGIPIGDLGGGVMGIIGVLSALVARNQTGQGQHVDLSMQDAQISLLNYMATMYFLSEEIPSQIGNAHFAHVPYDTFEVEDGYIIIAVITDQFWQTLLTVIPLSHLDTEENKTAPGRIKNRDQIMHDLSAILKTKTQHYWLDLLVKARIPCGPVNNFKQALTDPHVIAREMIVQVPHPKGGEMTMIGNPIKLSKTQTESYTAPPLLGQHNYSILVDELGLDSSRLEQLKEQGII